MICTKTAKTVFTLNECATKMGKIHSQRHSPRALRHSPSVNSVKNNSVPQRAGGLFTKTAPIIRLSGCPNAGLLNNDLLPKVLIFAGCALREGAVFCFIFFLVNL